jgi:hypothetical protein
MHASRRMLSGRSWWINPRCGAGWFGCPVRSPSKGCNHRNSRSMTEATDFHAKAIHRLLEVDPKGGDFNRCEDQSRFRTSRRTTPTPLGDRCSHDSPSRLSQACSRVRDSRRPIQPCLVPVAAHAASGIEWLLKLSPLKAYELGCARKGWGIFQHYPSPDHRSPTAKIAQSCPPGLCTGMIADTKMRATLGSPQSKFQPQKN